MTSWLFHGLVADAATADPAVADALDRAIRTLAEARGLEAERDADDDSTVWTLRGEGGWWASLGHLPGLGWWQAVLDRGDVTDDPELALAVVTAMLEACPTWLGRSLTPYEDEVPAVHDVGGRPVFDEVGSTAFVSAAAAAHLGLDRAGLETAGRPVAGGWLLAGPDPSQATDPAVRALVDAGAVRG